MKWILLVLTGAVGGWVSSTVTLTPNRADFGKAAVNGVTERWFKVAWNDTFPVTISVQGPNLQDFTVAGAHRGHIATTEVCYDVNTDPLVRAPCNVLVQFMPGSLGHKFATLIVNDRHGHQATAALEGEAVRPQCKPILVPCNYVVSYMGTISISQVDSTITDDHKVRYETVVDVLIDQDGRVVCRGQRNEMEWIGYKGVGDTEMKSVQTISGPGMVAIEFQPDESGRMTYTLTYACATPYGTRESRGLRGGGVEVLRIESQPADWRESQRINEPTPVAEIGATPLTGTYSFGNWDPDNKEGTFMKATWSLRTW